MTEELKNQMEGQTTDDQQNAPDQQPVTPPSEGEATPDESGSGEENA